MKKIGVFTSGGDSPGMNAAIRSVVRCAQYYDMQCFGIKHGYQGMIDNEIRELSSADVANIIQRGGTILKTSRCAAFHTKEGRQVAFENLKSHGIEGVVAIGGDGTFRGAYEFNSEHNIPFIGLPGTIDKDLVGCDYTIGYDTAVNTAMYAIDKIRDTADSHDRMFFIEVMGRDSGFIALDSGIATGAEAILIPETPTYIDELVNHIEQGWRRKKLCHIIIVAEGDDGGGAFKVANAVKEKFDHIETRVTILGHVQRGGSPTFTDRVLGSRLGYAAVMALKDGNFNKMVGVINNEVVYTPLEKAVKQNPQINQQILDLVKILSS